MSSTANGPNGPRDKRTIDERIDDILAAVELNHTDHEARIADHEARIAKLETIAESIPRIEAMLQKVVNIQQQLAGIALDA